MSRLSKQDYIIANKLSKRDVINKKVNESIKYLENDSSFNPISANQIIKDFQDLTKKSIVYPDEFKKAGELTSSVWDDLGQKIRDFSQNHGTLQYALFNFYNDFNEKVKNVKIELDNFHKYENTTYKMFISKITKQEPIESEKIFR